MNDDSRILARLEKLERQNRFMKRIGIACLLCVGVAVHVAAQGNKPEVLEEIRAKKFVVIDNAGRERIVLHVTGNENRIVMLDENRQARIEIHTNRGVSKDHHSFQIMNAQGKVMADLAVHERVGMGLYFKNRRGQSKDFGLSNR